MKTMLRQLAVKIAANKANLCILWKTRVSGAICMYDKQHDGCSEDAKGHEQRHRKTILREPFRQPDAKSESNHRNGGSQ